MAKKEQVWGSKWILSDHIGKGGQGLVYKAIDLERKNSNFVIKILKEQKNKNKRARMYREVASYKTLKCKGIPQLVDTNAELFETDEQLYIVTEFIPGLTLEAFVNQNGGLGIGAAINFMLILLSIVKCSHNEQILHRDIKPDNIILKDDSIDEPFLIDFGLSFNKDDKEERITPSSEQLTNRFLHLPELNNQEAKIDYRTDITYCGGIFFYVLTGIYPQDLIDHDNNMPHQRAKASGFFSKLGEDQANLLKGIFDRIFNIRIDYRYQSIEAFENDLSELLMEEDKQNSDPEAKMEAFREYAKKTAASNVLFSVKEVLTNIDRLYRSIATGLSKELGAPYLDIHTGNGFDYPNFKYSYRSGIISEFDKNKKIWPELTATINGSELVIEMAEGDGKSEVFRQPLSKIDYNTVVTFIRSYFLNRLDQLK